jgi:hypothetical protein
MLRDMLGVIPDDALCPISFGGHVGADVIAEDTATSMNGVLLRTGFSAATTSVLIKTQAPIGQRPVPNHTVKSMIEEF